tara:strand:- start:2 stop:430 length:429 start_codon:yes stop_codon:yes gene_type:complete
MERLNESRNAIHSSIRRLLVIKGTSPEAYRVLSPGIHRLIETQNKLESEAAQQHSADDLGFLIPLAIAGATTLFGFFGWRASKQLTEATDYDKRLEKFMEAKEQGLSDDDALRIIGAGGGFSLSSAIVVSSLALAAIFIFRK